MSIRPFVMPFRLSCAYLIYDADAALPHLNPRKRRRGGIFIYEKRDHCIISCNSLFIFLINANLLTLVPKGGPLWLAVSDNGLPFITWQPAFRLRVCSMPCPDIPCRTSWQSGSWYIRQLPVVPGSVRLPGRGRRVSCPGTGRC